MRISLIIKYSPLGLPCVINAELGRIPRRCVARTQGRTVRSVACAIVSDVLPTGIPLCIRLIEFDHDMMLCHATGTREKSNLNHTTRVSVAHAVKALATAQLAATSELFGMSGAVVGVCNSSATCPFRHCNNLHLWILASPSRPKLLITDANKGTCFSKLRFPPRPDLCFLGSQSNLVSGTKLPH